MARPRKSGVNNSTLLEAALEGLELQKKRIDDQIAEVRRMLKQPGKTFSQAPSSSVPVKAGGSKRPLSPAARKRIAAAQKKRWAAFRASQKTAK